MSEQAKASPKTTPSPTETTARPKKVRGTIHLTPNRCKGCGFCIEFCPQHVLEFSDEFNPQGYHTPVLVDPDGCTGCDLCGLYCPDFAIYGIMLREPAAAARGKPPAAADEAPGALP